VRVLVDTSDWSLALRKGGPAQHPAVHRLDALLEQGEDVFLTGVILQELLQAFRAERTVRKVRTYLEPFPLLALDRDGCADAAALHRRCAAHGISASTVNCQIATAAMLHGCALLTADRDFTHIARHSGLELA